MDAKRIPVTVDDDDRRNLWLALMAGSSKGQKGLNDYLDEHVVSEPKLMGLIQLLEEFINPIGLLVDTVLTGDKQISDQDIVPFIDYILSMGQAAYTDLLSSSGAALLDPKNGLYYTPEGKIRKANFSIRAAFQRQIDRFQKK